MDSLSEKLAKRTLELCRLRSPTGEEGALCDEVEAQLRGTLRGREVSRIGNSLVVGRRSTRPQVALVAHLDTVPFFDGDGEPRRVGSRIHGKGVSDMKGGLAVALELVENLPAAAAVEPVAIFYEREEGPYADNGLEGLFQAGAIPPVSLAICLEPTANALQLGCVGSLHATLLFSGKNAHSARPWEGHNAVHAAGPLLTLLANRAPREVEHGGLVFKEVYSVTQATGGRARNVVPDRFTLNLNYRFAPGKSVAEAQRDVLGLVGSSAAVEFTDLSPSGAVASANSFVQQLLGRGLLAQPKQAWTDVARFATQGIDAVNFGPGEPAQAHQVDEWAEVAALGSAYRTLWALFTNQEWKD